MPDTDPAQSPEKVTMHDDNDAVNKVWCMRNKKVRRDIIHEFENPDNKGITTIYKIWD